MRRGGRGEWALGQNVRAAVPLVLGWIRGLEVVEGGEKGSLVDKGRLPALHQPSHSAFIHQKSTVRAGQGQGAVVPLKGPRKWTTAPRARQPPPCPLPVLSAETCLFQMTFKMFPPTETLGHGSHREVVTRGLRF